jgi:hypothetical protein
MKKIIFFMIGVIVFNDYLLSMESTSRRSAKALLLSDAADDLEAELARLRAELEVAKNTITSLGGDVADLQTLSAERLRQLAFRQRLIGLLVRAHTGVDYRDLAKTNKDTYRNTILSTANSFFGTDTHGIRADERFTMDKRKWEIVNRDISLCIASIATNLEGNKEEIRESIRRMCALLPIRLRGESYEDGVLDAKTEERVGKSLIKALETIEIYINDPQSLPPPDGPFEIEKVAPEETGGLDIHRKKMKGANAWHDNESYILPYEGYIKIVPSVPQEASQLSAASIDGDV